MKVNLLLDSTETKSDYINIDQLGPVGDTSRTRDSLKNLSTIDDGELEELVALDILDYYSPHEAIELIHTWAQKIKHGGLITVGFTDLYALAKAIINRMVNLEDANVLLHGLQDKSWRIRKCSLSLDFVSQVLQNNGLKIRNKRLINTKGLIKAERP